MTTYNISGATLNLDSDGGTGNIDAANTINPVTGGIGLNTVRVVNTSNANIATMYYIPSDATYAYNNLAGTPSGAGANAKFNVTVANSGYQVAIANVGSGYANSETITILGNALGGTTTANDLTLTLTITTGGKIASVVPAGTTNWPITIAGEIALLPNSENFIQVTTNTYVGAFFASSSNGGNLLITPVTIVR
jgi:hypothetical protein